MSIYQRVVLPCLTHLAMRDKQFGPIRRRVVGAAEGRVLEIGAGSGLNFALYGAATTSVIGLDPSSELLRMARKRASAAPVPIALVEASAEAIPLEAGSVDTVVTTWSLCTIADAAAALAEMRRVLKPGGALIFVEHGRAPEPGVARWQDRLDPVWSRVAGGCHLNRQIDALIASAGFRIEGLTKERPPQGPEDPHVPLRGPGKAGMRTRAFGKPPCTAFGRSPSPSRLRSTGRTFPVFDPVRSLAD